MGGANGTAFPLCVDGFVVVVGHWSLVIFNERGFARGDGACAAINRRILRIIPPFFFDT